VYYSLRLLVILKTNITAILRTSAHQVPF